MDKNTKFDLFSLLSIESESGNCRDMQIYIEDYVDYLRKNQADFSFNLKFDEFGNIFITKIPLNSYSNPHSNSYPNSYPCIVAHMDTVHEVYGNGIVPIEIDGKITGFNAETMQQTGIGGDDKCGIWAALKSLERLNRCKIAFFVDEEIGCHGSGNADLEFFQDCRFILQADRRGNSDFVNNINGPISSREFQEDISPIIQKYGYSFCDGMMTDVEALSDNGVGVSCANISAGYYNPHTDYEYISIEDLDRVVSLIVDICQNLERSYPFDFSERLEYKEKARRDMNKMGKTKKINVIPIGCGDEAAYWSIFHKEITGGFNKDYDFQDNFDAELEKELDRFYGDSSDLDFTPGCNKK